MLSSVLLLSACATPARMHDEAQLNRVALGCGQWVEAVFVTIKFPESGS